MTRTHRHSKRARQKAKRKQKRKHARKNSTGKKAGSIAIHSCLPGLEGTEIGSMDVIVDARRKEQHQAEINVSVYQSAEKRSVVWSIDTGFGGYAPRVGYRVIPDGEHRTPSPITWVHELLNANPQNTNAEPEAT